MKDNSIKIYHWLTPVALLYGMGVRFRNLLFNWGILKSRSFDIPLICVGNLTVGGTGKTPHVEYLIKILSKEFQVGVLSRGYKRESKGFQVATPDSTTKSIGDEPYQIKKKFPEIMVAVDSNRCNGIIQLTDESVSPALDVIILDDAFQHRYVEAGVNILLVDYNRLITYDKLLPAGRLREPVSGIRRANMVIVTKCPVDMKSMDFRILSKELNLYSHQNLYFSSLKYGNLIPLFNEKAKERVAESLTNEEEILLITGIASPTPILEQLKRYSSRITCMTFKDHHVFTKADMKQIKKQFDLLTGEKKVIITTEKDAGRLLDTSAIDEELKPFFFYLPIEIIFLQHQQETFNQNIIGYVRKNKRNSFLSKRKNEHIS